MEPPGRAELHGGIVARQGRELPRICGLVEREEHEREPRVIPKGVEQRLQIARELRRDRQIGALVRSEAREDVLVMVAERSGVHLHHQSVFDRHPRHLHQHMRFEATLVGGGRNAAARLLKETLCLTGGEPFRVRFEHPMVGGRSAHRLEEAAPLF